MVWNLALLTQPIALASVRFRFGMSVNWVILANTLTYGLIGLIVETIRRKPRHAHLDKRACLVLAATLLCGVRAYTQQAPLAKDPMRRSSGFVVVVKTQSGRPVTDLQQQDFKVLDNNSIRPIIGFRVITKTERPSYEITFERATDGRPNEYHRVDIRVDRPNLSVLAPPGYYDWSVVAGGL